MPTSVPTRVRTTWLELRSPSALEPPRRRVDARLVRAVHASPELNRYLYTAVGGDWHWRDRLPWTWDDWWRLLARPGYETWYAAVDGTPAGYAELDATSPPDVEIACFGVVPAFAGRGLGGWLLHRAAERGFELGSRVWLHTCTLDGPAALPNYLARGFRAFRVEEHDATLGPPAGPWPGAERPIAGARP